MHVTAVGNLKGSCSLLMQILGFMDAKPSVGGLGHEVI